MAMTPREGIIWMANTPFMIGMDKDINLNIINRHNYVSRFGMMFICIFGSIVKWG